MVKPLKYDMILLSDISCSHSLLFKLINIGCSDTLHFYRDNINLNFRNNIIEKNNHKH